MNYMKNLFLGLALSFSSLSFCSQSLEQCQQAISSDTLQQEVCRNHEAFHSGVKSAGVIYGENHALYEDKSKEQYQALGIGGTAYFKTILSKAFLFPFRNGHFEKILAKALGRPEELTLVRSLLGFDTYKVSDITPAEVLISLGFRKGEISSPPIDITAELSVRSRFSLHEYQPASHCRDWPHADKIPEELTEGLAGRALGTALSSISDVRTKAATEKIICPSGHQIEVVYLICYYNPLIPPENECSQTTEGAAVNIQFKESAGFLNHRLF